MCDTICAAPPATVGGVTVFGKNSDRQRNEAQAVELFPPAEHAADASVRCTYIAIPQARRTHAVIICRPYWIWGAEMGANEHGVAIGNQSLFARSPGPEEPALLGMDLLRLALERAASAAEAVDVITMLLERHGQGGDGGHMTSLYCSNGFIISDPAESYVLETVGREWLLERVQGVRTISNCYSVGAAAHRVSAGIDGVVRGFGSAASTSRAGYPDVIGDPVRQERGQSKARQQRSTSFLQGREGDISIAHAMALLRDHGPTEPSDWNQRDPLPYGMCVHAGSDERSAQTMGAMVSELRAGQSVHWVTATAAPCTSIFKPVLFGCGPLPLGPKLTGQYDARTSWWRHERLHRSALMGDFPGFLRRIAPERDALEERFRREVAAVCQKGDAAEREQVVARCWQEAIDMEERWLRELEPSTGCADMRYRGAWARMNRLVGMSERSA
jgi:dipeptidase